MLTGAGLDPLGVKVWGAQAVRQAVTVVLAGCCWATVAGAQGPGSAPSATGTTLPRVAGVPPAEANPGVIAGTVQDGGNARIAGAQVRLDSGRVTSRTADSDAEGRFRFDGVPAGEYRVTVTDPGMEAWTAAGTVNAGGQVELTAVTLVVAGERAEVQVTADRTEIAAAQVELEEKQRVMGVIPNFYATYVWNAEPLNSRQKFGMAWKSLVDPVSFAMTGFVAGMEQSQGEFSGYRQGAMGYAKRFGAAYADGFSSTMIGQAILPAVFRQDPRYFVKGRGSVLARGLYAASSVVICRGDNRRWQPNYSNVLGNVASAGISNLYYPASNRHGASLTIENSMIGTGLGAVGSLFQEFVVRRLTPHVPNYGAK